MKTKIKKSEKIMSKEKIAFVVSENNAKARNYHDNYKESDGKVKQPWSNLITNNQPLFTFYQDCDGIKFHKGCAFVGYMKNGDSFIFSQGDHFHPTKFEDRVFFCLSRHFLERILKDHPEKLIINKK